MKGRDDQASYFIGQQGGPDPISRIDAPYARMTGCPLAARTGPREVDRIELRVEHQEADDGPLEIETPGEEPRAQAFQDRAGVDPFQRLPVEPGHNRRCLARGGGLCHGGMVPRATRAPQPSIAGGLTF